MITWHRPYPGIITNDAFATIQMYCRRCGGSIVKLVSGKWQHVVRRGYR